LALCGRRTQPLAETAKTLAPKGARVIVVADDLTREDAVQRVIAQTVAQLGGLDTVVNCAGAIQRGALTHELTPETFDRQIADNLRGVFLVTHFALPELRAADGDRSIVNIASTLAHTPGGGVSAYIASKGAIVSFTRAVAHEYAADGIRTNCVCPATVRTPMAYAGRPHFDDIASELEAYYPLGRLGEPHDVAAAVAYLASAEASWVTGVVLDVDGGLSVR
jgi:NAD(P)-dependent dehydrogenase (short-subunit alcohol dehydrogenase family)